MTESEMIYAILEDIAKELGIKLIDGDYTVLLSPPPSSAPPGVGGGFEPSLN